MEVQYLTTGVVAKRLGVSKGAVLRAVDRGELTPANYMPGGAARYLSTDVDLYMESLRKEPRKAPPRPRHRAASADHASELDDIAEILHAHPRRTAGHRGSVPRPHGEILPGSQPGDRDDGPACTSYYPDAISPVLALVADSVNAGAACLSRETADEWRVDHVFDRMGMSIRRGDPLPFDPTLVAHWRGGGRSTLVVEDVRADMRFAMLAHAQHVVGSCIGVPLSRPDGTLSGLLYVVYPLPRSIDRGDVALMGVAGSVLGALLETECLRIAERTELTELRASQAPLRLVFESVQDGVWQVDADGTTVMVNPRTAGMLGYTMQEMRGTSWSTYIDTPWEDPMTAGPAGIETAIPGQYDTRYRRKDGSVFRARVRHSALTDIHGDDAGALLLLTEVMPVARSAQRHDEMEHP